MLMRIFRDARFSWLWTILRVYVGYQWLHAGWGKVTNPKWVSTGEALHGYWVRAAAIPETGKPAITYDWYRSFIQGLVDSGAASWFGKLIAYGEVLVGLALILGVFTLVAAAAGAIMNLNFMLAGSSSTNPVLYTLAILVIVAGANAYFWGADRFIIPRLSKLIARGRLVSGRAG